MNVIQGRDLIKYSRPCVYAVYKNFECFYVGCSKYGIGRVFNHRHHIFSKEPITENDVIYIWFCDEENKSLLQLETDIIRQLKPIKNLR